MGAPPPGFIASPRATPCPSCIFHNEHFASANVFKTWQPWRGICVQIGSVPVCFGIAKNMSQQNGFPHRHACAPNPENPRNANHTGTLGFQSFLEKLPTSLRTRFHPNRTLGLGVPSGGDFPLPARRARRRGASAHSNTDATHCALTRHARALRRARVAAVRHGQPGHKYPASLEGEVALDEPPTLDKSPEFAQMFSPPAGEARARVSCRWAKN